MARSIKVQILGETAGLERSFHRAGSEAEAFGKRVGHMGVAVAKSMALAGVAVAAVGVEVGKKSVEAAVRAQESNDKLTQALKNQRSALTALSPAVLNLEEAGRKLGFTNEDVRTGLTKWIQTGDSMKDATQEMAAAQDLARAKGIALGDATTALIRLQAGNTRAAKEFGVVLPPVTAAVDKLKASHADLTTAEGKALLAQAKIQDKLATGQAYYDAVTGKVKDQANAFSESAAGGMARFHAAWQNIEEQLGSHLAPVLGHAASALSGFLDKFGQAQGAGAKFHVVVDSVKNVASDVFSALKSGFNSINWNSVWASVKVDANVLAAKIQASLAAANWSAVGHALGVAVVSSISFAGDMSKKLTDQLVQAARNINWSSVGKAFIDGFTGSGGIQSKFKTALVNIWKLDKASEFGVPFKTGETMRHAIVSGVTSNMHTELQAKVFSEATAGLNAAIANTKAQVIPTASAASTAIGAAMAQGAAAGLRAQAWALAQAAIGMVLAAVAAMQAALGIHSPSKLTMDKIGAPMGQGIQVGFMGTMGSFLSSSVSAIQRIIAAQTNAVTAAKSKYNDAFRQLAQDALAAFDAAAANWVAPAQKMLDKINADINKHDIQNNVDTAQTNAKAAAEAYTSATQQEGETPEEFAARRAELWQAVLDTDKTLKDAQRAQLLQGFADQAADQTKHHDAIVAKQRAHLQKIIALYNEFDAPMRDAGQRLTDAFANGFDNGMAAVVASAQRLVAALEQVTGHSSGGGGKGAGGSSAAGPSSPPDVPHGGGGRGSSARGGGNASITVNVRAETDDPRKLAHAIAPAIYRELLDMQDANGNLGFT